LQGISYTSRLRIKVNILFQLLVHKTSIRMKRKKYWVLGRPY